MIKLLLLILQILPCTMPAVDFGKPGKPLLNDYMTLCRIQDITADGLYAESRTRMILSEKHVCDFNNLNITSIIPGIYRTTIDYSTEFMVKNYLVKIL